MSKIKGFEDNELPVVLEDLPNFKLKSGGDAEIPNVSGEEKEKLKIEKANEFIMELEK